MGERKPLRVGLIGTGWIGAHHGCNLVRNPHVELTAAAGRDKARVRAFLDDEGIEARAYDDVRDMLAREALDAAVVASPNALHAEHAVAAAEAGLHLYLEKPLATTPDDCRRVVEAVRKAGVKCAMGYHRRFNPLVKFTRELQEQGRLGEPVLFESDYIHHIPGDWAIWDWLGQESVAGSLIHAGAGHSVDLARHLCGEVAEVSCFKDVRMPRKARVETEDIAVINLRFESGALGRIVLFVGPIVPFRFNLRLYGTRGTVDNNRVWLDTMPRFDDPAHEDDCMTLPRSWIPDNVQGGVAEPWGPCLDDFIDDLRLDRRPANDAASGFNTAAVCFAAVESAKRNAVVAPERA